MRMCVTLLRKLSFLGDLISPNMTCAYFKGLLLVWNWTQLLQQCTREGLYNIETSARSDSNAHGGERRRKHWKFDLCCFEKYISSRSKHSHIKGELEMNFLWLQLYKFSPPINASISYHIFFLFHKQDLLCVSEEKFIWF